jgi:FkbM family methyltransferase
MLRTMLERVSRGVVLRRRIPDDLGGHTLFVSPDSSLRYWHRDLNRIDPPLLDVVRDYVKPGNRVWDIGANVGLIGFAAAGRVGPAGHVLAVEADTWLVGLLRRSARERGPEHAAVEVLPMAVTDHAGIARFHIATRGRASNAVEGVGREMAGGTREVQLVPTTSLDGLLDEFEPPDFVKIDVEGAELGVLQGGAKVLSQHRPIVLCEVGKEARDAVTELLVGHRYALYDMKIPLDQRQKLSRAVWNTIAVPE